MKVAQYIRLEISLCLLLISLSTAVGEGIAGPGQRTFHHIGISDGLPSEMVHSITQDIHGFMWFGTQEGLCRFDGRTIRTFVHDPDDPTSLPNNEVMAVYADSGGDLWVFAKGLYRFNFTKETFERPRLTAGDNLADKLTYVGKVHEDQRGNLWIGTLGDGLYKMNQERTKLSKIDLIGNDGQPEPFLWIYSISSFRSDSLLVGTTGHQFFLIDIESNRQVRYALPQDSPGDINVLLADRKDRIWLAMNGQPLQQLTFTDIGGYSLRPINPIRTDRLFMRMTSDRENNIWIGSVGDGLTIFNPADKSIERYLYISKAAGSLPDDDISLLFEDRDGNMWIALEKGVALWARWEKPFWHFSHSSEDVNSINNSEVTGIDMDTNGQIWVSTWNAGFSSFTPQVGSFQRFGPTICRNCPSWIYDILAASDGSVWVASNMKSGLNRFDPKTGRIQNYLHNPADKQSLSISLAKVLFEDHAGTIWIGFTAKGLNSYNRSTNKFKRYEHIPGDTSSPSHNRILTIEQFDTPFLWIGTGNGLNRLQLSDTTFQYYPPTAAMQKSVGFNVHAIHKGKQNTLWLGTDSGLYRFDKAQGTYHEVPLAAPYSASTIFGIEADASGNLWMQSNAALFCFSPSNGTLRVYDQGDGWIQRRMHQSDLSNTTLQVNSGEMIFGGSNGITVFNPEAVKDNPYPPPVHITGIRMFYESVDFSTNPEGHRQKGDSLLTSSILHSNELTLRHSENTFSFEFAALDYTRPDANQYRFKLEGFQDDWVYGDDQLATFTNISPGDYVFRVQGSNSDGLWNRTGDSIIINILPPWWKSGWAYLFYILLAGLALYTWRRIETNRIRMENNLKLKELQAQNLLEIDNVKNRFFANISHEFRTPLTLILGPLENVIARIQDSTSRSELGMVHRNAGKLLHLINQLLDLSRLETNQMPLRVRQGDFIRYFKGLVVSFSSLADQKNISLRFDCDEQTEQRLNRNLYYDADKFDKIVLNLLSNAFKFTESGGTVKVRVTIGESEKDSEVSNSEAIIRFSDSGIGIPAEQLPHIFDRFYQVDNALSREHEGTGIGLALTMEMVKRHYGEIKAKSAEGKGTTFEIRLPLGKAHFSPDEFADEASSAATPTVTLNLLSEPTASLTRDRGTDGNPGSNEIIALVIDDHPDMRSYIRSHLSEQYHIVEASDGQQGIDTAIEVIPDLIISDVMMPKLDGYQVCKALKQNIKTSHIPVILLTAKAGEESKLSGLEIGADDYLTKPFSPRELKLRVKNLIEQRQKLRDRFRREGILQPREVATSSVDEQFLQKLMTLLEENMAEEDYGVEKLSYSLHIGVRQLQRKVRALTGLSPVDLMRGVRLNRAKQLLEQQAGNVSEIALEVGFSNPSYFAKLFKERFDISPSEFVKQVKSS